MQIELSKADMTIQTEKGPVWQPTFADAGPKYGGKLYRGAINMKAWEDDADTKTEPPVIDVNLIAPLKMELRASISGPEDTVIDGDFLTKAECYQKFTSLIEEQVNAIVKVYESKQTPAQRQQEIFDDPDIDAEITALEVKVNG